ncbi:MAG: hypothetical protein ABI867_03350, partial [Kofleriaceae bacterium]
MRWLVILFVLAMTGTAAAKLVIMDPPMVRKCPSGKTFEAVKACLATHATVTVLRQLPGARLLALSQKTDKHAPAGLLLYVQKKSEWRIGGHWENYSGDYQLLTFEAFTIGKHAGYRIEVGQALPLTVMIDNVSPVRGIMRSRRSLFCSGEYYACPDATLSCEVLVHGNAVMAFHGSFKIEGGVVLVKGDRSKAGPQCNAAPRVFVGWTQP